MSLTPKRLAVIEERLESGKAEISTELPSPEEAARILHALPNPAEGES